ncbi:hypothetical protein A5320_18285 [Rheinheimera sp. SA_1]|nr:hypothetical protein A5320_18285 [Rheinheimera sp. SA_1]
MTVKLNDGKLQLSSAAPQLPADIVQLLKDHKAALVAFLESIQSAPIVAEIPLFTGGRRPLSSGQQRLWFSQQLNGMSAVYNIPLVLVLHGAVDVEALQRALSSIVERQQILRTRLVDDGAGLVQQVDRWQPELPLEVVASVADIDRIRAAERAHCFNLAGDFLLRCRLLTLPTGDHYTLLLTLHHAIADAWSLGLLCRELTAHYQAACRGRPLVLPSLPVQYADYAAWQQQNLLQGALDAELRYWRQQLAALPPLLSLPTDRPRPVQQSYRGCYHEFSLELAQLQQLQAVARANNASLFMVLLSAYAVLLARYSGQQDIAIGTPIAGREHAQLTELIGFFVNSLVIRADLTGNPALQQVLSRIKACVQDAYVQQNLPFEQLVDQLAPERNLSYSPLFQVSFSLVNTPADPVLDDDLAMVVEPAVRHGEPTVARYDITFNLYQSETGLTGGMEYNSDLFDDVTIAAMLAHYRTILTAFISQPTARFLQLPLLSDAESRQQLDQWNPTARLVLLEHASLAELFERQVVAAPDAIAVVCGRQMLSYVELNRRANRLAAYLVEQGIGPDMVVGLCAERSLALVVGVLAIIKAGGCYLPLDPEYPESRLVQMLTRSNCRLVLSESHLLEQLTFLQSCMTFALDNPIYLGLLEKYADTDLCLAVHSETLAYLIYTSGSTGVPKGSAISHRNVHRLVAGGFVNLDAGSTLLCAASPSFDAFTFELWGALLHGGKVVLADIKQCGFAGLQQLIAEQQINTAWLTSALFNRMLDDRPQALAGLQQLVIGGEALSLNHVRRAAELLPATRIINGYGPTENTTFSCTWPVEPAALAQSVSVPIGRPLQHSAAYILDESMRLLPRGAIGQLYLAGAGLARGYYQQPALTAACFVPHPYAATPGERLYQTGDLARYLPDGAIEFIGRADAQVKIRGFRIEPSEIEQVLRGHPEVVDCVVRAPLLNGQPKLVAYVVPAKGQQVLQSSIQTYLKALLPDYMIPPLYVWLDAIPLTANRKVDVAALPAPDETAATGAGFRAPQTALEAEMAELWQANLGCGQVGVADNYFALGGDSIRAIALVAAAKKRGWSFTVKDLFVNPCIEALAAVTTQCPAQTLAVGEIPPFVLLDAFSQQSVLQQFADRPVVDAYPLSNAQYGMIFHGLQQPALRLYHMQHHYSFNLRWQAAIFTQVLAQLCARHPILRSSFFLELATPLQVVFAEVTAPLEWVDLRALDAGQQQQQVAAWLAAEQHNELDLAELPWRIGIRVLSDQQFVFAMTFHHAIWDGWSNANFIQELLASYQALLAGEDLPLLPTPPGYQHFIAAEQAAVTDQHQQHFWSQTLAGATLPWWAGETAAQSQHQQLEITAEQTAGLAALATELGIQQKAVWCSVYMVLLSLLGGQNQVLGNVVVHGRPETEHSDKALGLFLNALPLTLDITGLSWRQLMLQVNQQLLQLHAMRHFPLGEVQRLSGLELAAAMFNYTNFHLFGQRSGDSLIASGGGFEQTNYRFAFQVSQQAGRSHDVVHLSTDPAVFPAELTERLPGYVSAAVNQLLERTDQPIRQAALLGEAEQQQLLAPYQTVPAYCPAGQCLHQLFEAQAMAYPDRLALRHHAVELCYDQLNRRANRLAHWLLEQGVGPEVRVALWLPRSVELIVAILAVVKAGGVYVAVPTEVPAARQQYILTAAAPGLVLDATQLQALGALASYSEQNLPLALSGVTPQNAIYLIYTSGSTGQPKGVLGLHQSLLNRLNWLAGHVAVNTTDVLCQKASMGFVDSAAEIFQPLCFGATLVILDTEQLQQPAELSRVIAEQRISQLTVVPSLLQSLLQSQGLCMPGLRVVYTSGEALVFEKVRDFSTVFPAARLINIYGSTEVGADVSACDAYGEGSSPIGRMLANNQAYILDQNGELAPYGVPGQLYVGGIGLARGYLQQAAATAAAFVPNPFGAPGSRLYRSGDLVRYLPDGNLDYLGRLDQQLKIRGFRIEPGEVEVLLQQDEAVSAVCVQGQRSNLGDVMLVAYVASDQASDQARAELVARMRLLATAQLPAYMCPAAYVLLDRLPLNASGKVDRRALAQLPISAAAADYVPPQGEQELRLADLWQQLLAIDTVSRHDNFFELGGHSLLLASLMARIRSQFGVSVSLRTLFEQATLQAQAAAIATSAAADGLPAPLRRPPNEPAPLTYGQQRLWFLNAYAGANAIYNMPLALRFGSGADVAALEQAVLALLERHHSLRTCFVEQDGGVYQRVEPAATMLPRRSVADEVQLQCHYRNLMAEPFDLKKDLLCRYELCLLPDGEPVLLLILHHSIADGWSVGILFRELAACYRAFRSGQANPLEPLPLQYGDYAWWQRQQLQTPELQHQLDYWQQQLSGLPALLNVPTDRPRPARQSYRGSLLTVALPASLLAEAQQFANSQQATLFMVLLAAWSALLGRYTGQDDIAIGTPVANRNRQELEAVVGYFANSLVIRTTLTATMDFISLTQQVRDRTLGALAHQDVPFDHLVEVINPQRATNYSPLFQVLFALQNQQHHSEALSALSVRPLLEASESAGFARLDLALVLTEAGDDGLVGQIEYNTDLFDLRSIEQLFAHFSCLLQQALRQPLAALAELPLLSNQELQQRQHWNDTTVLRHEPALLHQLIAQRAQRWPAAIAVAYGERHLTYQTLDQQANRLAQALRQHGVGLLSPVGVYLPRNEQLPVALLAILKAGACYVPLDMAFPEERLRYVAQNCGMTHVIVAPGGDTSLAILPDLGPAIRSVSVDVAVDMTGSAVVETLPLPSELCPAYLIYTSGSTGLPKGVVVSHANAVNLASALGNKLQLRPGHRLLSATSLTFDASVAELFVPLACGACVDLVDSALLADGVALSTLLHERGISHFQTTPVSWKAMLKAGWQGDTALTALSCGEHFSSSLLQALTTKVKTLWNVYGPTETTVYSTAALLTADADTVLAGTPLDNTSCYILDSAGQLCPVGVAGELYIGGDGVSQGYVGKGALTAERFVPDPYGRQSGRRLYRTGDLVRYRADGNIEYLSRLDHQVKVRGFRIEPGEIEAVLNRHPQVRDAVVKIRPDQQGEARLVAWVVANGLDGETLQRFAAELLPEYMVPAAIVLLEQLPLTVSGKVDSKALPAVDLAALRREYVAPQTELELALVEIWALLLAVTPGQLGIKANFFEMGGHSLQSVRLEALVRERLGLNMSVRDVFDWPVLQDQARYLAQTGNVSQRQPLLKALRGNTLLPLSFAQQRLWFIDRLQGQSAEYHMLLALDISGPFAPAVAEQAFAAVIERHEVLRTVYVEQQGQVWQQVLAVAGFTLEQHDLQDLRPQQAAQTLADLCQEFRQRPFRLDSQLMLRAACIRLPAITPTEPRHILLCNLHHIAADGGSLSLLDQEFFHCYRALSAGEAPSLAALALQYADYACWQRDWLQGDALQQQLQYWQTRLADAPLTHQLRLKQQRPAQKQHEGGAWRSRLDAACLRQLDQLAQRSQLTPFMLLHSIFALVLARHQGTTDVLIGTPVANRQQTALQALVGLFVNTLVLRVETAKPSLADYFSHVRDVHLGALQHQDLPFERLVDALQLNRSSAYTPLFQILFSVDSQSTAADRDYNKVEGLGITAFDDGAVAAKFDLHLNIVRDAAGAELIWIYDCVLFERDYLQQLDSHLHQMLQALIAADTLELPPAQLAMLTPAELRCLHTGQQDWLVDAEILCLHQLFEQQAAANPTAPALEVAGRQFSYAELNRSANQLARQLIAAGVTTDSLVGICLSRHAGMIVALLAVLKAGGAYLPLDPAYPRERLAYMLSHSGAAVLLSEAALQQHFELQAPHIICLNTLGVPTKGQLPADATNPQIAGLTANQLAYLIYTSGSTGVPKGVAIEHRNTVAMLRWAASVFTAEELQRVLASTSLSFDLSVFEIFVPLSFGHCCVLVPDVLQLLEQPVAVSLLNTVPSAALTLLEHGAIPAGIRTVNLAGEPLPQATVNLLLTGTDCRRVCNLYGPSEDTTYSTWAEFTEPLTVAPDIGVPLDQTAALIVGPDLSLLPPGVLGELLLGGPGVARGYYRNAELTAERFIANPHQCVGPQRLYRTGDLVRQLPDGRLQYAGRIDNQVKIRGFRIEPDEIAAVLLKLPDVLQVLVVAVADSLSQQQLVAYYRAHSQLEPAALRQSVADKLPAYMLPADFVQLSAFPLTPNGKIDRSALPRPDFTALQTVYQAPQGELQCSLADIWATLLQLPVDRIGANANFYALGGHSLLLVRLASAIRSRYGRGPELRQLFEQPVLSGQAALLQAFDDASPSQLPAIPVLSPSQRQQPWPLSYAQQRLWFLHRYLGPNAVYNIVLALRLRSSVDEQALLLALQGLLWRHEALRTWFISDGDSALQQVQAEIPPLAIETIDFARQLTACYNGERLHPFELEQQPLCRVRLLKDQGKDGYALLLNIHHSVCDGWSADVLYQDLHRLYSAACRGDTAQFAPAPLQYIDYAHWQRQYLQGDVLTAQLQFWRTELDGLPPLLALPLDYPRPEQPDYQGAVYPLQLPAELAADVQHFAALHQATPYMVLLAAFSAVLASYSDSVDIAVGTPVANRSRQELEPVVGFFVNMLVVRSQLADNPDFHTLLARTKAAVIRAQAHQDIPFEFLVDALCPGRTQAHHPLFQVAFSLQSYRDTADAERWLDASPWQPAEPESAAGVARFDLTINLLQNAAGISGVIEYATSLFSVTTIAGMADALLQLLEASLRQPEMAVLGHFANQCRPAEDKVIAVWQPPKSVPAAYQSRCDALLARLAAAGVCAGDVVALCCEDSEDKLVAWLALQQAGVSCALVASEYPALRQAFVTADSGAKLLLTGKGHGEFNWTIIAAGACRRSPPTPVCLLYPVSGPVLLLEQWQLAVLLDSELDFAAAKELSGVPLACEAWLFNALRALQRGLTVLLSTRTANSYLQATQVQSATVSATVATPLRSVLLNRFGQAVPVGAYGRLHLSGGHLPVAVWRDGESCKPAAVMVQGKPWYATAIRARLGADGQLQSRAVNAAATFLPAQLTARLQDLAGVAKAAVFVRPGAEGVRYEAYVQPIAATSVGDQVWCWQLAAALRNVRLPLPHRIVAVAQLPVDALGRLDPRLLPDQAAATDTTLPESAVPAEGLETQLAAVWCRKLELRRLSRFDNYFALGGDSIRAIGLVADAGAQGLHFTAKDLFTYPTIAQLAQWLAQQPNLIRPSYQVAPFALLTAQEQQYLNQHYDFTTLADAYPLSMMQQGMVLHSLKDADRHLYHNLQVYHYEAAWDQSLFLQALALLLEVHPVLRSHCCFSSGRPLQVVPMQHQVPFVVFDTRIEHAADSKQQIELWMQQELALGLDVTHGWWRCTVHLLPEQGFVFGLLVHHAMWDGWSLESFAAQLYQAYQALLVGQSPQLPSQLPSYSSFIAMEQQALADAAAGRYWLSRLQLGTVAPWSGQYSGQAETFCWLPGQARSRQLTALARQLQVPEKSVWCAVYLALLSYLSGTDQVIGAVLNQGRPEIPAGDQIIGLFLNALPTTVPLGLQSWHRFIVAVNAELQQQLTHRHFPVAQMQHLSGLDLSAALFNYVSWHLYLQPSAAETVQRLPVRKVAAYAQTNYQLMFTVEKEEPACQFKLYLQLDQSVGGTACQPRIEACLEQMLTQLLQYGERPVDRTAWLDATQRTVLLEHYNRNDAEYPRHSCVHQLFEAQAAAQPDRPALLTEQTRLSYGELNSRANRLAWWLRQQGVGPESRVGLYLPRDIELIVAILAVLKAGGTYLAVPVDVPAARQQYLLQDAKPVLLLSVGEYVPQLPAVDCPCQVLDSTGFIAQLADQQSTDLPVSLSGVHPDNAVYLIYTSGSTGRPKGVLGLHRALVNRLHWLATTVGVSPADVLCQKTGVGFVDHAAEIFQPLCYGAPLVILPATTVQQPRLLAEALQRFGITQLTLVPSLLTTLLQSSQMYAPGLQVLYSSGEALVADKLDGFARCFPNARLLNIYGSTEVGADVTAAEVDLTQGIAPIGRLIHNHAAYVLDATMAPTPAGVAGELYIGGEGLARGYLAAAGQTADSFVPNPYGAAGSRLYRTGDLARWQPNGELLYLGRVDQQIKIRGMRIETAEIEAVLARHELVNDVVVQAWQTPGGQTQLAAWVVSEPQHHHKLTELLRQLAAEQLPGYMVPAAFVMLTAFALNTSGKIDRRALPAPELASVRPYAPAQGHTEQMLATLWQQLLGTPFIGRFDHFFELGGHSLLLTQLLTRVHECFAVEVSLQALFEQPQLHRQALLIDAAAQAMLPAPMVEPAGPAPLSFAQQRLWFLQTLMGPNHVYNMPLALSFAAQTDVELLSRSLLLLLHRHQALRTRFVEMDRQLWQVVDEAPTELPLQVLPDQATLIATWQQEVRHCFDLAQGPLCRLQLIRIQADGGLYLLLNLHHIIADGWSFGVIGRELVGSYQAMLRQESPALPELSVQYKDYAIWQRRYLQGAVLETQLHYWRQQLADLPQLLQLPLDRPRPLHQSFNGGRLDMTLPASLLAELLQLSQTNRVTLFMTLQAAWAWLLGRYAAQEDVAVGTVVANRRHSVSERLIGFFANTLVLRNDLSADPDFVTLLDRTREMTLQAYNHQDLPFELLVENINPVRSTAHSPLFQVMFVLQNTPFAGIEGESLQARPVLFDSGDSSTARFDLTLTLQQHQDGLSGQLEYNSDLFDAASAERILNHYQQLLSAVVANPARPLSQLAMLSAAEQSQQLHWSGSVCTDYLADGSVLQLLERQTVATPDAIAVCDERQSLTFAELNTQANRLAHMLLAAGVGLDTAVGLCLERSVAMIVGLWGILKAGGCYVPLEPDFPAERLQYICDNSAIAHIVSSSVVMAKLNLFPQLSWYAVDSLPASARTDNPAQTPTVANLSYILYTSGSTGRPKGVAVTHGALLNRVTWMLSYYQINSQDRVLQKTPFVFDVAGWEFYAILAGCTLVMARPQGHLDPAYLAATIQAQRITMLHFVPSMLQTYLAQVGWHGHDTVRQLFLSGEAVSLQLQQQLFEQLEPHQVIAVDNAYGPTEATIDVSHWRLQHSAGLHTVPIGRPIDNVRLYVADEQLQLLPAGCIGMLYIGGAALARGYINRAALTAASFIPDPFSGIAGARLYRSGDLVRYLPDGTLQYVGRADHQIKLRGARIEPAEIERLLLRHPQVEQAVAVVWQDTAAQSLTAYVVAKLAGGALSTAESALLVEQLSQSAWQQLPAYMVPTQIVVLDALPLTPSGKLDRQALPEPRPSAARQEPPQGELEMALAQLWQSLLQCQQVSRHDSFFQLGGHSLLATQLVSALRQLYRVELSVRDIFEHNTLATLAAVVAAFIEQRRHGDDALAAFALLQQQIACSAKTAQEGEI